MKKHFQRAVIEVAFIVFLFYTNLLMGEFVRGGQGQIGGFWWAIGAIFTIQNFLIAIVAGFIGYIAFEFLRKRF
jgi:hypothetical protein